MVKLNTLHLKQWAAKAYDAVVIGAGHNGLVAAAYLQKHGYNVCVLEKRNIVGGAAVTEEIVPGFKFSRASYVLSLLRPVVYQELKLKEFGLKVLPRDPSSYTPLHENLWSSTNYARSLTLGTDCNKNAMEISKFSKSDAAAFALYEKQLARIAKAITPLMDVAPSHMAEILKYGWLKRMRSILSDPQLRASLLGILSLGSDCIPLTELLSSAPLKILQRYFESEVLVATLAMDALIGTTESADSPGSGFVLLLHSILGECAGGPGRWGIPVGGMGAVSDAIAASARSLGVQIEINQCVSEILLDSTGKACGVRTHNGDEIAGRVILSNATPKVTFLDLLPRGSLSRSLETALNQIHYSSGVTKINVAVNQLPNFAADPHKNNRSEPHHQTTIHINSERIQYLEDAIQDFKSGMPSKRPIIEMVIPSVIDASVAPKGGHVVLLLTQYTPYKKHNCDWTSSDKEAYASTVLSLVDEYAPGFQQSVLATDVLTPSDLENVFGLTGGNIFHGAMTLDKLFWLRPTTPVNSLPSPFTAVPNLFLCGSNSHFGGGVSGAPGRCCALQVVKFFLHERNATRQQ